MFYVQELTILPNKKLKFSGKCQKNIENNHFLGFRSDFY